MDGPQAEIVAALRKAGIAVLPLNAVGGGVPDLLVSIRRYSALVEVKAPGTGLGAMAGAVVGGLVGSQLGSGHARAAATVVGAGAGAIAGYQLETAAVTVVSYQVRVRMSDGSTRTFYERAEPGYAIGETVRVPARGPAVANS